MIKKIEFDPNSVAAIKHRCWAIIDALRKEIDPKDFNVALYLLTLYKKCGNVQLIFDLNVPSKAVEEAGTVLNKSQLLESWAVLLKVFRPTIEKLNEATKSRITKVLESSQSPTFHEHFPEIFDYLLYELSKSLGKSSGEFYMPFEVARFLSSLVKLPPESKVYNPFAGVASFGILLPEEAHYHGQEINARVWALGALRIMAYERPDVFIFENGDSIENWNPKAQKFDLIVANPPFGMRLPDGKKGKFGSIKNYDHFFIEKGVDDLNADGKLVAIIPQGFLVREGVEKSFRKFLVDADLVDTVISLPGGLLNYTGLPITILVIDKSKRHKGIVRFIDAKKFVHEKRLNDYALNGLLAKNEETDSSTFVRQDTIREFDYNLNPLRYFIPKFHFSESVPVQQLQNILTPINGRKEMDEKYRLIRIRDLKSDRLDYLLDTTNVDFNYDRVPALLISESCLLLASRWNTLKPTFFNYDGEPITITPDIFAYRVDQRKVEVEYLVSELHADYILGQLRALQTGSVIPSIKKSDILNIQIQIPDPSAQREIIKKTKVALVEAKRNEFEFLKKLHGLENEIVEQNTYLRHALAGPTSNLKGAIDNIKQILKEKVHPIAPNLIHYKVSDQHELTFGEYLEMIEKAASKISNAVTRQLKVETDIESHPLSLIEIISFVDELVKQYRAQAKFTITFGFDKEAFLNENGRRIKTFILGNSELLHALFENLIENAKAHAFHQGVQNRIEIYLMKYEDDVDSSEVQLLISNTGKPFPENFTLQDFIRKGSTAGPNSGQGFGGWYVNEIVKHMNGRLDIINEAGPEGLGDTDLATSFEITFPITESDENEKI